jgi:hypothetical protein
MRNRGHNSRRGSALIEAALVLPVFGLLALGTSDLTRTLYLRQVTEAAARAGAHRALLCPPGAADLRAIEQAAAADGASSAVSARARRLCSCEAAEAPRPCETVKCTSPRAIYVRVETSAPMKPVLPLPESAVRASAMLRVR